MEMSIFDDALRRHFLRILIARGSLLHNSSKKFYNTRAFSRLQGSGKDYYEDVFPASIGEVIDQPRSQRAGF